MTKIFQLPKYYEVHINEETGEVKIYSKSKKAKGREMAQYFNPSGYLRAKLNNKNVQIHQLVAKFYLGEANGLCVNHKDGNKLNNKPDNLEYVSIAENIKHSIKHGLHICNRPENLSTFKDGRTRDKVKYKNQWYVQNKERISKMRREYYLQNQEEIKASRRERYRTQ